MKQWTKCTRCADKTEMWIDLSHIVMIYRWKDRTILLSPALHGEHQYNAEEVEEPVGYFVPN